MTPEMADNADLAAKVNEMMARIKREMPEAWVELTAEYPELEEDLTAEMFQADWDLWFDCYLQLADLLPGGAE